jgi:hypothetical protein
MHTHVFPERIAAGAVASLSADAGISASFDGTVSGLRGAMRRADVSLSVVQPVASKPSQVRSINEWLATIAGSDIVTFGAMHPDIADLEDELVGLKRMGFPGFKLHPEYQRFTPDDPRLDALYEIAAHLGLIVFFHAGEDIALPDVRSSPQVFARLLDRHPRLTMVLAHLGGWRQWDAALEHLAGRRVYLDTSFTLPYLGSERFVELVQAHGCDKVLFGSDGPWADVSAEVTALRHMPFPEHGLEAILHANAACLLSRTPGAGGRS